MTRFEKFLAAVYNCEVFPLFLGMLGQAGLASQLRSYLPAVVAVILIMAWWPFWFFAHLNGTSFRLQSRLCWGVGIYWAAITISVEALIAIGYIGNFETFTECRILMHLGWLYFVPTIHRSVLIRRYMRTHNPEASPDEH